MLRTILAALAGYAVWTVLWLAGNKAFFEEAAEAIAEGGSFTEGGPLIGAVVLAVVCSLAGGLVSAKVDTVTSGRAALVLGFALLATGVAVQARVWAQLPVWYHLAFLAVLVPMTLHGSRWGSS